MCSSSVIQRELVTARVRALVPPCFSWHSSGSQGSREMGTKVATGGGKAVECRAGKGRDSVWLCALAPAPQGDSLLDSRLLKAAFFCCFF